MKLFCAVVGVEGSLFRASFAASETVADLKKQIKAKKPRKITCDADELKLYLARKSNAWLADTDPAAVQLRSGQLHHDIQALIADNELEATWSIQECLNDSKMAAPQARQIHILVVIPSPIQAGAFSAPISFGTTQATDPITFRTNRLATVEAFFRLLFPDDGDYVSLIFVRAPPLSGKSVLCDLLYNYIVDSKPAAIVAKVEASSKEPADTFAQHFKKLYSVDIHGFCAYDGDRVLLIDDGQFTYDDELLWNGYVKQALEYRSLGLRFVIFSSYGSFDTHPNRNEAWVGTAILIPVENTFGLTATPLKPGQLLKREELDEMIYGSIFAAVGDLIWILSSGHVGIARAILRFVSGKIGPNVEGTVKATSLEEELRSHELLYEIRRHCRGIPTVDALHQVIENRGLSEGSSETANQVLTAVAMGHNVRAADVIQTVGGPVVVDLLTQHGFLYEDEDGRLQFASSMHLKIWLLSNGSDSVGYT